MIRNFKVLGLALVAALAMTAMAASAASAAEFHSEGEDTTISGGQTTLNIFTSDTGEVECEEATFTSDVVGPETVSSVTVTPAYDGCTAFGLEATVRTNGCAYVLYSGELEGGNYEGSVDIECPAGQEIEVDAAGLCVVNVPAQEGLSNVTYTNEGSGASRAVIVDANVSGIAYEEEGFFCANPGEATNNGTYTGAVTVTGDQGGIFVE